MAKITNSTESFELDVKRCYLPIKVEDTCPNCAKQVVRDLEDHYLSYPDINAPFDFIFYHDECGCEWKIRVILQVNLSLAT